SHPVEIEITAIPPLAPQEQSLIELHSLLNVLNVLQGELIITGLHLADDPDLLRDSLAVCERVKVSFTDPARALDFARRVREEERTILAEIAAETARRPAQANAAETRESLENIRSVFQILGVRAQEVLARAGAPDQWLGFPLDELRADFQAVFAAIEKNSKGRYRIIYNLARQQSADYYVDFVIESANSRTIAMPMLFKDVMRDLIANARKYTPPGGTINIGLYETGAELRFVVQDTGCGIPPGELETVVHFGRRGTNVRQVRTMGGGFGLTKAFLVTKRFGGRFWLKSELGIGTRVTITLPRPAAA
ncbi:MAG: ATP-binding protein, partial [Opitutales bacterium]